MDKRSLLRGVVAVAAASALSVTMGAAPGEAADATGVAVAYQINARHDGNSPAGAAAPPLTEKWRRDLGRAVSYPVIADNKAFVTVRTGDDYGTSLYAIDTRTGADVWGPVELGGTYYWSALTLGAGRVYAINGDGRLTAFAMRTGRVLWQTDLPGQYSFSSAPTFRAGMVYTGGAGSGGTVYAVNAATGAVVWTAPVANGDQSSPAVTATGVYVSYACEQSYRFDPATGATRWVHSTGCSGGGGKTPVVAAGGLWVRQTYTEAPPVLNLNTGQVKTRFGSWGMPAPAFSGRTGFFVVGGELHAADAATPDKPIWTFTGDGSQLRSAPIVVNGYVYVGSQSGTVFAVDPATGQAVWSADTGAEITPPDEQNVSTPLTGLAAGQGVLLVPASGRLVAYGG
ncbi:MAG TPA: PQQ-binding-like beta-propeller repeat protein [Actinoplanes sp.]